MRIEPGETHTRQLGESLWLLTLRGEHDLSTVPDLEAAFARVESSGTTAVIDLTGVTFVDSSVIGLLIREHKRGENLLVVAPTGCRVRRLVDLVALPSVLPIFETREEAFRSVPVEEH